MTPKFKVGDVVVREDSTVMRVIRKMEYDREDDTWYLAFSGEEEAEWDEGFYKLIHNHKQPTLDVESMSVEELASLSIKVDEQLKKKKEECEQEIVDWVASLTSYGDTDPDDLKNELFENTQFVIDMLKRYLDKKGK